MMWKESYKLGNELIDAQHNELFTRTEKLLGIVDGKDFLASKEECINTILFLKEYALKHFVAEEDFQASVGYVDMDMHKLIHDSFVSTVLAAEDTMVAEDFSLSSVKEFCGFLTAWLTYHVAGADRKIIENKELTYDEMAMILSPKECFMRGTEEVFATMFGESANVTQASDFAETENVVSITAEHGTDLDKDVTFSFTKETALNLVNSLTGLGLTEIDELATSILHETTAIIIRNAAAQMAKNEHQSEEARVFAFNTMHGKISITLSDT